MISVSFWTAVLLLATYVLSTCWSFAKNIRIAQKSGIPYVIVPYYSYNRFISILGRPLFKFLDNHFPEPSITSWRHLVKLNWPWNFRHAPFVKLGTDTFLTVAPGGIILYTADADVISQVTSRWTDFPKPTHLYRSVNIYGKNIVSSEGAAWCHHRKLTSPSFGEKNNQLVWKETLYQSQAMLKSWLGNSVRGKTINHVSDDTMQLSLNVISHAGLSRRLEWSNGLKENEIASGKSLPNGHTMSFTYSLHCVLSNLLLIMLLPKWLLRNYPSAMLRKSCEAYDEWGRYMKEIVVAKRSAIKAGSREECPTVDIIGQLVKGYQEDCHGKTKGFEALTDSEVMGNLFVFMLAGHETSANSIHFSLLLLAIHPDVQKAVQKELDEILQGRPVSEWNYERDLHRLLGGMLGAVLNEQLRLIAPVITVPKTVSRKPQTLKVNGKEVTVPPNIMVRLCVSSVHRNPKFWPHGPSHDPQKPYFPPGNIHNDLEEFKPGRWLPEVHENQNIGENTNNSTTTNTYNDECPATATSALYTPIKGSYIPFSDGQRACLGRRFAQVEIIAALAVILSQCSVELAVDEWANDDVVDDMTESERRALWTKARDRADWIWQNKMVSIITLQLRGAKVPLRFARRGEERFWDL